MKVVKEFSPTPPNFGHRLDKYKPESEEDNVILEVGEELLKRYCAGGETFRTEYWDYRPVGLRAPSPLVWLRKTSNRPPGKERVPVAVTLTTAYRIDTEVQDFAGYEGRCFAVLDVYGPKYREVFDARYNVRENGVDWFRKRVEEILSPQPLP